MLRYLFPSVIVGLITGGLVLKSTGSLLTGLAAYSLTGALAWVIIATIDIIGEEHDRSKSRRLEGGTPHQDTQKGSDSP